jgi:hypothetical protein
MSQTLLISRPLGVHHVELTSEILGSERDIPDGQNDRGNESNDRLGHDDQPSGLEVVRNKGPSPNHDNGNRTSSYCKLISSQTSSPMGIAFIWAIDHTRLPSGWVRLFKKRLKSINQLLLVPKSDVTYIGIRPEPGRRQDIA